MFSYCEGASRGEVAEWFIAAVFPGETVLRRLDHSGVGGSNPPLSARAIGHSRGCINTRLVDNPDQAPKLALWGRRFGGVYAPRVNTY